MKKLRALLMPFLFYVPFGAGAAVPVVAVLLIAGAVGIAGFSIYRSLVPVNFSEGLDFFGTCWSCTMFSEIIGNLSNFIPKMYDAIGVNILPVAAGLTFVWFAWTLVSDFINAKPARDAWAITGEFGSHLIKLTFIGALLVFPLPRFLTDTFITPIMNVGLSLNNTARDYIEPENNTLSACMLATAVSEDANADGAYSPKLKNNITCQIAEFHKMTGLGMTTGWTFLNMSFDTKNMYFGILPNVMFLFAGIALMALFLWALFPVPLYFFEVFIKLSMDMIMLPLMLLGWLFNKWKIFPDGVKGIQSIIDDVVKSTCGIALVGLFTGFALLFLNEVIGGLNGIDGLVYAIQNNDSEYLMQSLSLNNKSAIDLIFAGIFMGMFMNAIPALIKQLFKEIDTNAIFKNSAALQDNIGKVLKNTFDGIAKVAKAATAKPKE